MSSRAGRRAGRAQEVDADIPSSGTTTDVSEPNSASNSRRSRRNREGASEENYDLSSATLNAKADSLEQAAERAEVAVALGRIGTRFRNQKRSQATKPSGEDDDMVVLDDDQGPGLQSGNTDMFDLDKMDSSGKGQPGSNNNSEDDFCCWKCNRSLLGYRFVNKDANSYCVNCYHELFANTCESCNDTITVDDQDLAFKGKHWHDRCFKCSEPDCGKSLVGENFGVGKDKETLYCTDCYEKDFAPKCFVCNEPFKGGMMKLTWNGNSYHSECFKCANCSEVIGKDSFHPHDNKAYCEKCWDHLYSVKCTKCKDPIKANGVTYRMEPYHRECFTCSDCGDILAGQRFTLHEDNPICSECFGKKYAHKCYECNLPIKGDSGNRYLMFEDHFWHCECFYCAKCNLTLLGSNFIADQPSPGEVKVYCQPCGFAVKGYTLDKTIFSQSNKENEGPYTSQDNLKDNDEGVTTNRRSRGLKV